MVSFASLGQIPLVEAQISELQPARSEKMRKDCLPAILPHNRLTLLPEQALPEVLPR